jgi:hypothetical protein
MEVAWDSSNKVAIIIDYNSFANLLKEKAPAFYSRFVSNTKSIKVAKNYYDEVFSERNTISTMEISSTGDNAYNIKFDGNSELVKEIKNEEWNNIDFTFETDKKGYYVKTNNYVFSSMLDGKKNERILLDEVRFNFEGTTEDSIGTTLKRLVNLKNSDINKDSYSKIYGDFDKLFSTFLKVGEKSLKEGDFSYETLDIYRIFRLMTKDNIFNILVLANRSMLNYNLNVSDLFADYPNPKYSVSVSENNTNIKIILRNNYKERIEYNIVL